MIFLLTNKSVVRVAKVESFVSVDAIMRRWQLFEIMIAESVPRGLLKRMESDALITGVNVRIVPVNFVIVENSAAAAATVFNVAQFRFLLHVNQSVLTVLPFLWSRLQ